MDHGIVEPRAIVASIALTLVFTVCLTAEQPSEAQFARVASVVDVHILPGSRQIPPATLVAGTTVKVLGRDGEWVSIEFHDSRYGDRTGYVLATSLIFENGKRIEYTGPADVSPAGPVEPNARDDDNIVSETIVVYESVSEDQILRAIQIGRKGHGSAHGVFLQDAADAALPTMGTLWKAAATAADLRVQVFSTLAWIRQLASDAAKRQGAYSAADVTAETLEPVLRIVALVETGAGRPRGPAVRQVVLADADWTTIVRPVFEQRVSEVVDTLNERIARDGVYAKFSLEDVDRLRGPRHDRVFYVRVTRDTGEPRDFKVTNTQLDSSQ